tara:strand:+ start:33879 stop:34634 length:756 start_codon:yes stop_codon:yes gene_type:complete
LYERVLENDNNRTDKLYNLIDSFSGLDIKENINYNSILLYCKKLAELPNSHVSVKYVRNRRIRSELDMDLFYTEDLGEIANKAGYNLNRQDKEPRLIIPIRDSHDKLYGLQARSLNPKSEYRYITLYFNKKERLYGLNKVDVTKPFNVCEGPIDSFFIENCIALCGSNDLDNKYSTLATVILDNEPRNVQIVNKMLKYVERGFRIVVWPDNIKQKDINDMVMSDLDVNDIVLKNVYDKLQAKIKINNWKKV